MRAYSLLLGACLLLHPITSDAQVLLAPEPQPANQNVACGKFTNPATPLTDLRDHYLQGRWTKLIADTKDLLAKCTFVAEKDDASLFVGGKPDYARDWYLIVLGTVDRDDQPLVIRFIVHEPLPYPYSTHTLGVPAVLRDVKGATTTGDTRRLVQVFLTPNRALTLETKITATETSNPLQDQVVDVVKAVIDPAAIVPLLKGILPTALGAAAPAPVEGPVFASVSRVMPPFDRADYKYTDVMRAPSMLDADKSVLLRDKFDVHVDAVQKTVEAAEKAAADTAKAAADLQSSATATAEEKARAAARRDAAAATAETRRHELDLARHLATDVKAYVREQSAKDCSPSSFKESCWTGLTVALKTSLDEFCLDAARTTFCQTERDELMMLRFNEVGQPAKPTTASITTTMANLPYQRYSFGTIGAYIATASASSGRVKTDTAGKIVSDPIGRAMTAVILNIHRRFDPKAPRMEKAERWRTFVGGVLTPNVGVTVGAGWGLFRNLSVNGGYAVLVIPTVRDGDAIGAAPAEGNTQFKARPAHITFIGLGYKFGK